MKKLIVGLTVLLGLGFAVALPSSYASWTPIGMVSISPSQAIVIGDDDGNSLEMDDTTGALNTIDYPHHEVHAGSHYFVKGFATVADNASINFVVTVPDTAKWPHMEFTVNGTTQTEILIYESASVTGGTAVTINNSNRNSSNTSNLTIVYNPTITDVGTLIYSGSSGLDGATPSKADMEGLINREQELILKQNTTYIFRFISRGADNVIDYNGEWYEHTNR